MCDLKLKAAFLVLCLAACGDNFKADTGMTDAGSDGGRDGGRDGATQDGSSDGAMADASSDGATLPDGSTPDASTPDGSIPDGSVRDGSMPDGGCIQAPITLATAGNFAVLAFSTVTSTGPTIVTGGHVGVWDGTAVVGFVPTGSGIVNGGAIHAGTTTAMIAQGDLTAAFNEAAGRSLCAVSKSGNLGGMTLAPGLYKSTTSLEITSGTLVLDAQGDSNAVFIFQAAETFTTGPGLGMMLIGNAKASNVYWQIGSSASINTTSMMYGTIMAQASITLATGASLNGRALARTAAVTMDSNAIMTPAP